MPKMRKRSSAEAVDLDSIPPPKSTIPLPKGWQRATDAFESVISVSTIFPDFNRATRVGGLPVGRMHTVHGPTHGGKTGFVLGLVKSFVAGGHSGAYVDAELSTPKEFVRELIGDLERYPDFIGKRPKTYEETIDAVDEYLEMMAGVRKKNPNIYSICVIDSINKLTPEREMKNVLKTGGEEVSKGHGGRYRAAVNQSWLNHLSPMLSAAGCAMVFIAQERDSGDGELWEADGGVEIKGGQALKFDASLLIRVSKSMAIRDTTKASEKSKGPVIGFAHKVRIYKSKVSHMDGAYSECTFHLSNGALTPAGFDLARDAVSTAQSIGLVKTSGSWLSWQKRRWQGTQKAVRWLGANPNVLAELVGDINSKLKANRAA